MMKTISGVKAMAGYKGTGVVFMRSFLQSQGAEIEQRFLATLSEEERRYYQTTLEFHWIPIEVITRFFEVAAPLVFPGRPDGLRRIGREMAFDHLRGIYRIVLRVITTDIVIEKSARLWSTYHQAGLAKHQRLGPRLLQFSIYDYPDLPEIFRECSAGYMAAVFELCGVREVRVSRYSDDNRTWHFRLSWL
jgi:hypothetical protein